MKQSNRRKLSILNFILVLLFIVPLAIHVPEIAAETEGAAGIEGATGLKAIDLATYQDLADVDDELVTKFMDLNFRPGASMDVKFNLDAGYEIALEDFPPQDFAIDGDIKVVSTENYNAMVNLKMSTENDEGVSALDDYIYLVDAEEGSDEMRLISYYDFITEDEIESTATSDYSTVQEEIISRSDLENFDLAGIIDEIKSFTTMKLVEDHGEEIDVVLLLSMKEFNDFMNTITSFVLDGEIIETFEDELANETLDKLAEEFGVETFVLPIYATLDKTTGQLKSARFTSDGIQEIIDKSYEIEDEKAEEMSTGTSFITIELKNFSFELSNVEFGQTDEIVVPDEILETLEAMQTMEATQSSETTIVEE